MNRSYRGLDGQMNVKERSTMLKEKEGGLAMFMEMPRREMEMEMERERESLLVRNSDEFDAPLGSKHGTSPVFNIAASTPAPLRKTGPGDFLNLENDKNDYDWLLTPPDIPLFPSLEKEAQKTYVNQHETPKGCSTSINSLVVNPRIEVPKRNSLVPKQLGSIPSTPTGRATLRSTSRPATPNGYSTLTATSRTSRPSTPKLLVKFSTHACVNLDKYPPMTKDQQQQSDEYELRITCK